MKRLSNKLFLSILTVALTFIALGTTTFAWFTLTNTAAVNQFEFNVQSGEGIEIKLGDLASGNPWLAVISSTAIQNYLATEGYTQAAFTVKPVTSSDGMAFKSFSASPWGEVGNGYTYSAATDPVAAGFVEFTLSFRSPQYSQVQWTGVSLDATGRTLISDVDFTGTGVAEGAYDSVTIGNSLFVKASNATRISIMDNTATTPTAVAYENPFVAPTLDGEIINVNNYANNTGTITGGAFNYYNAKNVDAGPYAVLVRPEQQDPSVPTPLVTTVTAIDTTTNAKLILTMTPDGDYYTGQVVIRIWIEGWDAEAFNAILNDVIRITLSFMGTGSQD